MKEQYETPKTEVILLEEENIILTSTASTAGLTSLTRMSGGENVDMNPGGAGNAF